MLNGSRPIRKMVSLKLFTITLVALLTVLVVIGYAGYSTVSKVQLNQDKLQSEYNQLAKEYLGIENVSNGLQTYYNNFQIELSDMQAQLSSIQTQFNSSQSNQQALQTQYAVLQSEYSALDSDYTNFVAAYQNLQPPSSFNYLIYSNGGDYYAENGATSAIAFSGTNATVVGQDCINALSSSGGEIVFEGTINLEGPLTIQGGASNGLLELSGFGPSTQLDVGQGQDGIEILGSQAFGSGGPFHVVISDLVLTTDPAAEGKFMNCGIYIKDWFDASVDNVMVFYANDSGINIEDSADVKLNNVYVEGCYGTEYGGVTPLQGAGICLVGSKDCYFDQCYSDTNEIGFLMESNVNTNNIPTDVFLTQCEATLCQQYGISIAQANGIVVSDSLVEGSNGDGIFLVDCFRTSIADSIIKGNVGSGIVVTSQASNMTNSQNTITDCTLDSNGQNGIGIWSKNNEPIAQVSIEGCTIINSGAGARGNPPQPNTWDGINISNDVTTGGSCQYINIEDCLIGNIAGEIPTQNYGILSLQNSDYTQVFHNTFFQNIAGDYALAGSSNSIGDNQDQ